MAAPHLQINQTDLSVFMRVAHEDGLDPVDNDYSEPQFSGSPAFSEGAAFVGDAVGNREISIPLFLSAESEADLHQLIRDINQELVRGASVEYANTAESEITYFDLERGRLDVEYQYWIARAARTRATLRLWTKPYGHTGTNRIIATTGSVAGPFTLLAATVLGDVDALVTLKVQTEAGGDANTGLLYGMHPHPSHISLVRAASIVAQGVPTLIGASAAYASQARAMDLNLGAEVANAMRFTVASALTRSQVGRHRVLAPVRTRLTTPSLALSLGDHTGATAGRTVVPTHTGSQINFGLYDFGEINFSPSIAEQYVQINAKTPSSATALASHVLIVGGLFLLPVEHSAGGVIGASSVDPGETIVLEGYPRNTAFRTASGITGLLTKEMRGPAPRLPAVPSPMQVTVIPLRTPAVYAACDPIASTEISVRERFAFLR